MDLSQFAYNLPEELIARAPLARRDASRLFVYDIESDTIAHSEFSHLPDFLSDDSFLVLNETAVVPARVHLTRATGSVVEVLFLTNEWNEADVSIKGLVDRRVLLGEELSFKSGERVRVVRQNEKIFYFSLLFPASRLLELLRVEGVTPTPKYLGVSGLTEEELRERYQTVFAKEPGSVAAPTASLHFTPEIFDKLSQKNVAIEKLTLSVGLGTFAPFTEEQYREKRLHSEKVIIDSATAKRIEEHKREGKKLVAVGTTATRALESYAIRGEAGTFDADLFIYHPYSFLLVDQLITNFHLPKSSLMLLVDAFLRDRGAKRTIRELYDIAIAEKYRFFSFGDAMFLK